jgi:hypothetical protein
LRPPDAFLDGLTPEQHERTTFPVDDLEWRMWSNTSGYQRQGVSFEEMSEEQRELAFGCCGRGSAPGASSRPGTSCG